MTGVLATTRTRVDVAVPSAHVSSVRISSAVLGSRSTATSSPFDVLRTETSRSTWSTPSEFATENLGWRRRPCTAPVSQARYQIAFSTRSTICQVVSRVQRSGERRRITARVSASGPRQTKVCSAWHFDASYALAQLPSRVRTKSPVAETLCWSGTET